MPPPRRPAAALRCLVQTLCGGVVWAVLATEVHTTSSGDPSHVDSSRKGLDHYSSPAYDSSHEDGASREAHAVSSGALLSAGSPRALAGNETVPPSPEVFKVEAASPEIPKEAAAPAPSKAETPQAEVPQVEGPSPELSKLKDELSEVKGQLLAAKESIDEEKTKLASAEKEKAAQEEENKKLVEKSASLEATISELQGRIDTSAVEKSQSESLISDLNSKILASSKEKSKLEEEVQAKDATISEQTDSIKSKAEDAATVQNELNSMKASLASTQEELASTRTDLQKQMETLKSEKTEVQDELSRTKSDAERVGAEAEKRGNDLQALRKEHLDLHGDHDVLSKMYADPSVQHFLRAKAIKVYHDPGVEGAANKTFVYILPSLQKRYDKGNELVKASKSMVYSKLNAYLGSEKVDPWLPMVSGSLVYGTIIVPFLCTVCCLTRIVCKLKPLLLFCHLDFLLTTLCAGIFALYTGKEPLAAFAHHDASVYLFTQVMFAIAYCLYFLLLIFAYCCSKGGTYEGMYRCLQILGAAPIAVIYYQNVWTPAMLDQMPHMDELVAWMVGNGTAVSKFAWLPYLPVSFLFLVLLRLERLSWLASRTEDPAVARQDQKMAVVMRNDVELANIEATLFGQIGEGDWGDSSSPAGDKES